MGKGSRFAIWAMLVGVLVGVAGNAHAADRTRPEDLVVLVRPTLYPESISIEAKPLQERPLERPLAGGLSLVVALDRPDQYAIPERADLVSDLRLDERQIWRTALENTRARLPSSSPPLQVGRPTDLVSEDGLAPSVLAFDGLWDSPDATANGPVVAAVIAKNMVYLALARDTALIAKLRALLAEQVRSGNGLTDKLLIRRDGRWEVLD